jgi:hypothetical protein
LKQVLPGASIKYTDLNIEMQLDYDTLGLSKKSKSINRRGRKGKTQSSQRAYIMCFSFAFFATS